MDTPSPTPFIVAAANEGIPVMACARIFGIPSGDIFSKLHDALAQGNITLMPKWDWPATGKLEDRLPTIPRSPVDVDLSFRCQQFFTLTPLEAGFLGVLLRHERVTKQTLHAIVIHQRFTRANQPDSMEEPDPKMVDVMICKLRKKLKKADETFLIKTIFGGGYCIEPAVRDKVTAAMNGAPHAPQEAFPSPADATDEARERSIDSLPTGLADARAGSTY